MLKHIIETQLTVSKFKLDTVLFLFCINHFVKWSVGGTKNTVHSTQSGNKTFYKSKPEENYFAINEQSR